MYVQEKKSVEGEKKKVKSRRGRQVIRAEAGTRTTSDFSSGP